MGIQAPRYPTDSFIGTFSRDSDDDMQDLEMVRHMVSRFNGWLKQSKIDKLEKTLEHRRKPKKSLGKTWEEKQKCRIL